MLITENLGKTKNSRGEKSSMYLISRYNHGNLVFLLFMSIYGLFKILYADFQFFLIIQKYLLFVVHLHNTENCTSKMPPFRETILRILV